MRETLSILPFVPTNEDVRKYSQHLEYLFQSADFQKEVKRIRKRFKIPENGITNINNEEGNQYDLYASLMFDKVNFDFCKPRIKRKHRYEELNIELMKLLDDINCTNLPIRFLDFLRNYIVLHHLVFKPFESCFNYICSTSIKVINDNGTRRVFLEIFGDTTKSSFEQSWVQLECAKERYQLRGSHLLGYQNYYKSSIKSKKQKPVDSHGNAIKTGDFDDPDKVKDNIDVLRFKRYQEEHYSK